MLSHSYAIKKKLGRLNVFTNCETMSLNVNSVFIGLFLCKQFVHWTGSAATKSAYCDIFIYLFIYFNATNSCEM